MILYRKLFCKEDIVYNMQIFQIERKKSISTINYYLELYYLNFRLFYNVT